LSRVGSLIGCTWLHRIGARLADQSWLYIRQIYQVITKERAFRNWRPHLQGQHLGQQMTRMANYTKRDEGHAGIARMMDAGIAPLRFPPPPCEICGAPAVVSAYTFTRAHHFCEAHREEANKMFGLGGPTDDLRTR
jgi:hypothetical protein